MQGNGKKSSVIGIIVIALFILIIGIIMMGGSGSSSSSSYQLHNKDGSINWEYYNDMQDYFAKHPEKLP